MDLAELERLAKNATPGPWHIHMTGDEEVGIVRTIENEKFAEVAIATTGSVTDEQEAMNAAYLARCSPERILAMIECIKVADVMRDFIVDEESDNKLTMTFDAARAKLDEEMK